jgi:hypothetical protein
MEKVDRNFIEWALGSVVFGFVMPMLFPAGAYQTSPWLIVVDAVFLIGGVTAVPILRGYSLLVLLCARRRGRPDRGGHK